MPAATVETARAIAVVPVESVEDRRHDPSLIVELVRPQITEAFAELGITDPHMVDITVRDRGRVDVGVRGINLFAQNLLAVEALGHDRSTCADGCQSRHRN